MSETTKVAIVTGAGGMRAIGRGIALFLARDGYDVSLVDIKRPADQLPQDEVAANWKGIDSVAEEIGALGRKALPVYADISQSGQVDAIVEQTLQKLGRVDLLVNNARAAPGGSSGKKRDSSVRSERGSFNALMDEVIDLDENEWDRHMAVNARGAFLCSRAVARYFVDQKVKGRIVNITSSGAKLGGPGLAAYSASKFAINGLTRCLAQELAHHGITVNDVCPGLIDSGRLSLREKAQAEQSGMSLKEYERERMKALTEYIPTGELTTPEDIAAMVAFLASPQARQITGQSINVNGGSVMF